MKYISLEEKRLPELVSLWNSEIGLDFPMREELFKQNSLDDVNVIKNGSFIAIDGNEQVVGFVIAKSFQEDTSIRMRRDIGWIQALLVKTSFRNNGIGSALLTKAEKALNEANCTEIFLGRDPGHYFPGIPVEYKNTRNWFERKGYEASGVESDLYRKFSADEIEALVQIEGVKISLVNKEDKDEFLSFFKRCFPGRWEYEATQYFEKGGTGREFIVFRKESEIIGFCRINDQESPVIGPNVYWAPLYKGDLGGIGPLGIDQRERKKGYGLALVRAGISFLRERQINNIVIDWTGLVDFYKKVDFDVWKQYQQYSKKV